MSRQIKTYIASMLMVIGCFPAFAANLVPQMVGGVLVMLEGKVKPIAQNDHYRLPSNVETVIEVLDNDTFTDGASLQITQSANSTAVWDNVNKVIRYTPDPDFFGMDYFTYQIVDASSEVSNPATVEVEAVIGKAAKPVLTPLNDFTNHLVWLESGQTSVTVTITTASPDAKIMMELLDRNTLEVTPNVEYTGPFTLYTNTRVVAWAYGPGYDRSASFFANYMFCEDGSTHAWCGYTPPTPVNNGFGWNATSIKVGQSATLSWDFTNVSSCVEETSSESGPHTRPSNGQITYNFDQAGNVQSKWHCRDSNQDHVYPANNGYLYADLTVEKLDKPLNLEVSRGYDTNSLLVSWLPVNYAHHYQIQTKTSLASYWNILQECSVTVTQNCFSRLNGSASNIEVKGLPTSAANHQFKVIACTQNSCDNTGVWSDIRQELIPSNGMVANNDSLTIPQNSSATTISVMTNDVNPYPTTAHVTILSSSANGAASVSNNEIVYTPNTGFSGIDRIEYRTFDITGNKSNIGVVTIDVTSNLKPVISSIADQQINEDAETGSIAFTISHQDPNVDVNSLKVNSSFSNLLLVAESDITISGIGANRTINVAPKDNKHGSTIVGVIVSDGTNSTTESFEVTVNSVNDAPKGSVTINGLLEIGETLSISQDLADVDGIGTLSYQWNHDGVAIVGATSATYVVAAADGGKQMSVTLSYIDGDGTNESVTSALTAPIGTIVPDVVITGLTLEPSIIKVGVTQTISFSYENATKCFNTDDETEIYYQGSEATGNYSDVTEARLTIGSNTHSVTCQNSAKSVVDSIDYTVNKLSPPTDLKANSQ